MEIRKDGFTLIELLVVIAIIALLMAVIMPALGAAKEQARAVVCRANVKQWATCYALYTEEYDQSFPPFMGGTVGFTTYMENLRPYYDDVTKMRLCPSAAKVATDNPTGLEPLSYFGSTFSAWQIDPVAAWLDNEDDGLGSYGENSWLRQRLAGDPTADQCWVKMSRIKTSSRTPMFADAKWNNAWPRHTDPIPGVNTADNRNTNFSISNWSTMDNFVMRRHKNGLNVAFADLSAAYIDAEALWTLKWNQAFEIRDNVDLRDLQ